MADGNSIGNQKHNIGSVSGINSNIPSAAKPEVPIMRVAKGSGNAGSGVYANAGLAHILHQSIVPANQNSDEGVFEGLAKAVQTALDKADSRIATDPKFFAEKLVENLLPARATAGDKRLLAGALAAENYSNNLAA